MLMADPAFVSVGAVGSGDGTALALLNDYQRDFPLVSRPFARIGREIGWCEAQVVDQLGAWLADGTLSRVGPVFAPRRIGASTLAALKAPPAALAEVAERVSAHPEVNHNYAREHVWNLWFVLTAPDTVRLARVLRKIRRDTGCPVIALPLRTEFHIDLGFDLIHGRRAASARPLVPPPTRALADDERDLLGALQAGLPLQCRPFAAVARRAGLAEAAVIDRIATWLDEGILKRFGVIVRHHELGYRANAMCVWDVPDRLVAAAGARLASADGVNLCYRRARAGRHWPYNLYCMIHGHDRGTVMARLALIRAECALDDYPGEVLFSTRRYKQCGARYAAEATHG